MFRVALLILFVLTSLAVAQQRDPWLGKKVFWKTDAIAKADMTAESDSETVDLKLIPFPSIVEDVKGEWLFLGRAWIKKKDVVDIEEAIEFYTERIRQNPNDVNAWQARGNTWANKKRFENAIKDLNEAIRLIPHNSRSFVDRGLAWRGKGDLDAAIKDYSEAIRIEPEYAMPFNNRGFVFSMKGDFDAAIKDYTDAIRLDPKFAMAYANRGLALSNKGNPVGAIQDYREAIRLNPNYALAHNRLAWLHATCPNVAYRDGKRAVDLATKACELIDWKEFDFIDTLAASYAESEDWPNAVKYQEMALGLATTDMEMIELRQHMELYKKKQPCREVIVR